MSKKNSSRIWSLVFNRSESGWCNARCTFYLWQDHQFSGKNLSYKDVLENLNVLDQDYFFKFFDAFLAENTQSALLLFDQILKLGFDPEVLLEGLGSHARNLLICRDDKMISLFDGSEESKQRVMAQAKLSSESFLMSCLSMINESEINLNLSRNKRLHIEILLARICQLQRFEKLQFLRHKFLTLKKNSWTEQSIHCWDHNKQPHYTNTRDRKNCFNRKSCIKISRKYDQFFNQHFITWTITEIG